MQLKVLKASECQDMNDEKRSCLINNQNWTVLSEDIDNQGSILASLEIPLWNNLKVEINDFY